LLPTDLDADGHPEILAVSEGLPFWVRLLFQSPSVKKLSECIGIDGVKHQPTEVLRRAIPVLDHFGNSRLLRWRDGKAAFKPFPNSPSFVEFPSMFKVGNFLVICSDGYALFYPVKSAR
jgi:hypothetical protein